MRKSIDGLCTIIKDQLNEEQPDCRSLYLFCGKRRDRIKAILKEYDGLVMIYKRLTADGRYRWPRKEGAAITITEEQLEWLLTGMDVHQKSSIRNIENPILV